MKKETAVEWFVKELFKKIDYIQVDPKLIKQAIAMEKEQSKTDYEKGQESTKFKFPLSSDAYYEETYGK